MNLDKTLKDLEKSIQSYKPKTQIERVGKIMQIADGVVKISGLEDVGAGELIQFANGTYGYAMNLEEDSVGAIVLGNYLELAEGDTVKSTGRQLSIPVSDQVIGRVVNSLGEPIDGKGRIKTDTYAPLEKLAPGVTAREPVNVPLQTGIKAIDSMIPVGRGQRELIIGDKGTGKTAIAVDTIINQAKQKTGVISIYVAIGQKTSRVAQLVETLRENKALDNTIIVAANSSDPAALLFLAPYAGCAISEYFMSKGKDVVIFYDDLSKHAWAYREVSLILRRPSGREAYPGDIFYLHSRLLERACRMNKQNGGGSVTAFPIIETLAGDISAYIPTNVISITDGQIFLENDLFYAGIRPAINVGLSVSRVGGSAQIKAMKKVAGSLRIDLAQYRELSAFVQFASELDEATRTRIDQGSKMVELLKQLQFDPIPVEIQVALIWAGTKNKLKDVNTEAVQRFEIEYREYLVDYASDALDAIRKEEAISPEAEKKLESATNDFLEKWQASNPSKKE